VYLSYDIKGIQQFIYSIPRLKCMIGASSQIVEFDKFCEEQAKRDPTITRIFSAGGHGAFALSSQKGAATLEEVLIREAHRVGLDLRTGIEKTLTEAVRGAVRLHPFVPKVKDMEGPPCSVSALWPVGKSKRPHRLVQKRVTAANNDALGKALLGSMREEICKILQPDSELQFFRNVSPEAIAEEDDDPESVAVDEQRARAGFTALGGRNRWAVVALDGNDLGRHFEALEESDSQDLPQRLALVSESVSKVTSDALKSAILDAIQRWKSYCHPDLRQCSYDFKGKRHLVLPIRPVICGGDDVVILMHSTLAMPFVEKMAEEFAAQSQVESARVLKQHSFDPWKRTGGRLTLSAGVLYCKSSLPLHIAIPYTESLVASAKGRFRGFAKENAPSPAAVDWESVTDSMIDTPANRRQRESVFVDSESKSCVYLTRRPYLLGDAQGLDSRLPRLPRLRSEVIEGENLDSAPTLLRALLEAELRNTWSHRKRFLLALAKDPQWSALARCLDHPSDGRISGKSSRWFTRLEMIGGEPRERMNGARMIQETDVLDALSLLAEQHRMEQGG
jgi:hypothetical protein